VAEAVELRGVLILATYRPTDVAAHHPLSATVAALQRMPEVDHLALHGLSDDDLVALLEAGAGRELDREGTDLAHALRRETGGNPLFAGEILRHLAETGVITSESGRWASTGDLRGIALPHSIRNLTPQPPP